MGYKIKQYPFFSNISGPIAIAHRFGNGAGPNTENTILALESAIRLGYTYVETDTVATKDGVALVFHGSRTERLAKQTGVPTRRH